jgi:hypothetical protein
VSPAVDRLSAAAGGRGGSEDVASMLLSLNSR